MTPPTTDPVVQEYEELAPKYDSRWSFYIRSTIENTVSRIAVREGDRILDVGCGTGQLLSVLRRSTNSTDLFGVDASQKMLAIARSRLGKTIPLARASAETLPYADRSFDWVVSTSVFHYLREPEAALREFHRVLRPAGQLVITDWCDDYLACKLCDTFLRVFSRSHYRTYTRRECDELLDRTCFRTSIIDRYRINWLWGLMTAQARKEGGVVPDATPHPP